MAIASKKLQRVVAGPHELAFVAGQIGDAQCLHRVCPLCERENSIAPRSRYSRGHWTIKRCPDCRFVYLENVLSYDELTAHHTWFANWQAEHEFRRRRSPVQTALSSPFRQAKRYRQRLRRRHKAVAEIERFIPAGRVLEVGCASGVLLQLLDERYVPYGIEIGAATAQAACERLASRGGEVLTADALSGLTNLPENQFDCLLMHAYLEHENQPLPVLEQAARVLRPGGGLVIKVPNFACLNRMVLGRRWPGFRFPDHVNYFTPRTLRMMLNRAGLELARCNWRDRLPTSDNLWMLARKC